MADSTEQQEKRFEMFLAHVLRAGFLLSAVIVFAAGVLYLIQYHRQTLQYAMFHGEPTDLRYARDVVRDAFGGHSRGLIQLGLLLLIATPVARVAFSVVEFVRERDWLYVTTTLIVLGVLIYSLASA